MFTSTPVHSLHKHTSAHTHTFSFCPAVTNKMANKHNHWGKVKLWAIVSCKCECVSVREKDGGIGGLGDEHTPHGLLTSSNCVLDLLIECCILQREQMMKPRSASKLNATHTILLYGLTSLALQ